MRVNLDQLTAEELQGLLIDIEHEIKSRDRVDVDETVNQIHSLAESVGLTADELLDFVQSRGKGKGKAPKYCHPNDPTLTWSGRGKRPKWFAALIEQGVDPESLLVKPNGTRQN